MVVYIYCISASIKFAWYLLTNLRHLGNKSNSHSSSNFSQFCANFSLLSKSKAKNFSELIIFYPYSLPTTIVVAVAIKYENIIIAPQLCPLFRASIAMHGAILLVHKLPTTTAAGSGTLA